MADDIEAAELDAQTTVFLAASAVLSNGQPLNTPTIELLRSAMATERLPPALITEVCDKCTAGLCPENVPVNGGLSRDQAALFAAAVILFALRATPHGDPLELAARICAPYGVTREFVSAFARELGSYREAGRSSDTAASLRLLLEPPEMLVQVLRRYQGGGRAVHRPRRSIAHVSPRRIQHPGDREASDTLRELSGLDDLVGFVMQHATEKLERVNNVGGKVRISPAQFPGLYEIYRGCVTRAGVAPEPELYLENGGINAYTFGSDRPYIVLQTGSITLLSTTELEFILGHELGHIRFQHVLYLTLARKLNDFAAKFPLGSLLVDGLELALHAWERKAELSADRMGLLVSQDPDAALRVMVKLSGVPAALYRSVNIDAFLAQYEDFQALDGDLTGAFAKVVRSASQTHPWTVVRAHEIRRWVQAGEYGRVLGGPAPELAGEALHSLAQLPQVDLLPFECPVCNSVVAPDAKQCGACGGPCTDRHRLRRCGRCGVAGKWSLRFCESCGTRQSAVSGVAR